MKTKRSTTETKPKTKTTTKPAKKAVKQVKAAAGKAAKPALTAKPAAITKPVAAAKPKTVKAKAAKKTVEVLLRHPVHLRRALVRSFGYRPYFQNLRENAIFEATKAATIKALINDAEVDGK